MVGLGDRSKGPARRVRYACVNVAARVIVEGQRSLALFEGAGTARYIKTRAIQLTETQSKNGSAQNIDTPDDRTMTLTTGRLTSMNRTTDIAGGGQQDEPRSCCNNLESRESGLLSSIRFRRVAGRRSTRPNALAAPTRPPPND